MHPTDWALGWIEISTLPARFERPNWREGGVRRDSASRKSAVRGCTSVTVRDGAQRSYSVSSEWCHACAAHSSSAPGLPNAMCSSTHSLLSPVGPAPIYLTYLPYAQCPRCPVHIQNAADSKVKANRCAPPFPSPVIDDQLRPDMYLLVVDTSCANGALLLAAA
jgi:hypothetical protein